MPDETAPDIQAKLSDLCREISIERNLDAQQQEKLQRQAEETFDAYLNGEKPLSEDEAFVLVQEHFGDPAVVKELFDRVHTWEARATLGRRLVAAFILMFALVTLIHALRSIVMVPGMLWLGSGKDSTFFVSLIESQFLYTGSLLFIPLLLWVYLRKWQRAIERGDRVWFLEWTPQQLVTLFVFLYFAQDFGVTVRPATDRLSLLFPPGPNQAFWALYAMGFAICSLECGLIFWWCDRPPRRRRAIAYTLAAWVAPSLMKSYLIPVPATILLYTDLGNSFPAADALVSLGQLHLFGASWQVGLSLRWVPVIVQLWPMVKSGDIIRHHFFDLLVVHAPVLLPALLVALGFLVVRYRQGEVDLRSPFRTRMQDLIDMTPIDENERTRDGRDGD